MNALLAAPDLVTDPQHRPARRRSATGLAYNTLYYIYHDDPDLLGGAVSYQYSTTKADALGAAGRFFDGSIVTPVAGGADTIGHNDGGAGAQIGTSTQGSTGSGAIGSYPYTLATTTVDVQGTGTVFLAYSVFNSSASYGSFFVDGSAVGVSFFIYSTSGQATCVWTVTGLSSGSHTIDFRADTNSPGTHYSLQAISI